VPYRSPRADERSPDQPCSEGSGSASAGQPLGCPPDAAVGTGGPGTDDVGTAKSPTTNPPPGQLRGPRRSLASSETAFRRSASLRPSSDKDRKRQTASPEALDDEDAGRIFVRQRSASFSVKKTSTEGQNDVSSGQRRRSGMSAFGLPRPRGDDRQGRTSSAAPGGPGPSAVDASGTRGVDETGLPPASDAKPRRLPPLRDDVSVWATRTVDRPSTKRRRRSEGQSNGDQPTAIRYSRHRQRHRRHGNDDDGVGGDDERRDNEATGAHYWLTGPDYVHSEFGALQIIYLLT